MHDHYEDVEEKLDTFATDLFKCVGATLVAEVFWVAGNLVTMTRTYLPDSAISEKVRQVSVVFSACNSLNVDRDIMTLGTEKCAHVQWTNIQTESLILFGALCGLTVLYRCGAFDTISKLFTKRSLTAPTRTPHDKSIN